MTSRRLEELGQIVATSLGADTEAEARRILSAAFGPQIDDIRDDERGRLHDALVKGDGVAVAALIASPRPQKTPTLLRCVTSRAWFDDLVSLYAFERDARRERGALRRSDARRPRRLVYELVIDVYAYDEQRAVRIEFPATSAVLPSVFVDGPGDSPHRFEDGSLCMYHPDDPPERRWIPNDGLAALLDRIRAHLFQEAEARAGHGWPGDEAPHRPPRRQRRRR